MYALWNGVAVCVQRARDGADRLDPPALLVGFD